MTKRYTVFAMDDHYPNGGMSDYKGSCDTIEEAMELVKTCHIPEGYFIAYDQWHVYDTQEDKIVAKEGSMMWNGKYIP